MRVVFAGTPSAAVTTLEWLLESRHEVVAVVTRPDAPAGRGRHLVPSPVAVRAGEAGLEVLKPSRVRDPSFLERLTELAPDCCPVTAYGALLPQVALDIPAHGWVNLHFSLLPAWRGAAPVQHALLHGDDITGATTFQIVRELDAGPVYGMVTEQVLPGDTTGDLLDRLAEAGSALMVATLDGIEDGTVTAIPQPHEGVSLAPKLAVSDARVDWERPAFVVDRVIRACTPDPGAWTPIDGGRLKLYPLGGSDPPQTPPAHGGLLAPQAPSGRPLAPQTSAPPGPGEVLDDPPQPPLGPGLRPGEVSASPHAVYVGTGTTPVLLGDVQPPGKRRMAAADWVRGLHGVVPRLGVWSG